MFAVALRVGKRITVSRSCEQYKWQSCLSHTILRRSHFLSVLSIHKKTSNVRMEKEGIKSTAAAGDVAQWQTAYLACVKPWVSSTSPPPPEKSTAPWHASSSFSDSWWETGMEFHKPRGKRRHEIPTHVFVNTWKSLGSKLTKFRNRYPPKRSKWVEAHKE